METITMNRLIRASFLLFIAMTVGGCSVNPVSGKQEIMLLSVENEKKLGADNARQVEMTMGLINRPRATVEYVQTIGKRLSSFSPYQAVDYQFHIANSKVPNAFALPGGYVYVTRGLLILVNSEDELAGVIGHEVGHVAARHAVERLTRAAPIGIVTGITAAAVSIASPTLATVISGSGNLLNAAILAPYSRNQENEADKIGQELAARAGWDPEGITNFLKTLEREAKQHEDNENGTSIFATHPATPKRIQMTSRQARDLSRSKPHPIAKNHRQFLQKLDSLIVGEDASQGVFIKNRFLHPSMKFAIEFPPGWKTANTPQYVAAVTEQQDALIVLQLQGKGKDPVYAARSFLTEKKMASQPVEKLKIKHLPAAQTVLAGNGQEAVITWIAYQDQIYRLAGVYHVKGKRFRDTIHQTVASFHPLTKHERAKIKQQRLRIFSARAGEKLSDLLRRAKSPWDEKTCAIANGLATEVPLKKGQLIKVAVTEAL